MTQHASHLMRLLIKTPEEDQVTVHYTLVSLILISLIIEVSSDPDFKDFRLKQVSFLEKKIISSSWN